MAEQAAKQHPMDKLFAKLMLAYGRKWLSAWEGLDIDAVKADWSLRLAPFATREGVQAIAWVIENALPADWPPTALEFVELVRRAPRSEPAVPQLQANRTRAPQALQDRMEQLARCLSVGQTPRRSVADSLQALADSGRRLSPFQREVLRAELARREVRQGVELAGAPGDARASATA